MIFDDIIKFRTRAFFDVYAEKQRVIYRPNGGTPRPIRAIIERNPPEPVTSTSAKGRHTPTAYTMQITVENDPVHGIDIRTFNSNLDKIDAPLVVGGPLEVGLTFSGAKIVQDAGMLTLKVM